MFQGLYMWTSHRFYRKLLRSVGHFFEAVIEQAWLQTLKSTAVNRANGCSI